MSHALLQRIRIVLVETSHPGNIGAAARAMRTMGLAHLYLVRPARFPCAEATARAAGADELLYRAAVCSTLEEAVADCAWTVATSARARRLEWPRYSPRECAARAIAEARGGEVALVFGREQFGLTNEELDRCQAIAAIPADPEFCSLNMAAAVQLFAYELRCVALGSQAEPASSAPRAADAPVTTRELEGLYTHLETALADIGYYDPNAPKLLMRRLRRLFGRVRLERAELDILRGILAAAQRAAKDR